VYAARFEFLEVNNNGIISVISSEGEVLEELVINDCPEITGLFFSKV
jgi:hypothetical protein